MPRTQFCAKNTKNDLKPTEFVKHNFYLEMEGVCPIISIISIQIKFYFLPCINTYHVDFVFQWPTNSGAVKSCPYRLISDSYLLIDLNRLIRYLNKGDDLCVH